MQVKALSAAEKFEKYKAEGNEFVKKVISLSWLKVAFILSQAVNSMHIKCE